jgi:dihydrofolate synthase/folylpolyglutamate synthase
VIGQVDTEPWKILRDLAHERGSTTYLYNQDFSSRQEECEGIAYHGLEWQLSDLHLGLRGHFQSRNAAVALAALEVIQSSFPVSERNLRQGLGMTKWPGRLDVVSERPFVILDGAHNPQAIAMLVSEIPAIVQGRRVKLLFGVMRDKDWQAMVPALARIADEVAVTRVQQARAEDPTTLQAAFMPFCPVRVVLDAREACRQLLATTQPDEAIVVTGSLFLVGEVYPLFSPTVMTFPPQTGREEER